MKTLKRTVMAVCAAALPLVSAPLLATSYLLDETTCIDLVGTWTTGSPNVCEVTDLNVATGDELIVEIDHSLVLSGAGFVHAGAGLRIDSGAFLTNINDLTNEGTVIINGSASNSGLFHTDTGGTSRLYGTLANLGTVSNGGDWHVAPDGVLDTSATVRNQGLATFRSLGEINVLSGALWNYGEMINSGPQAILTIEDGASFSNLNAGTTFLNFSGGRVGNRGDIFNGLGATLTNRVAFLASTGRIINHSDALIENNTSALLANLGATLENWSGFIDNSAAIHNIGVIENYCAASFNNRATGAVANVGGLGQFDNYGGVLINAGTMLAPPTFNGCMFMP